jgi:hypothetical protein
MTDEELAKDYRLSTIKMYESDVARKLMRTEVEGVKYVESQMLIWMCEQMRACENKVAKCITMMTEAINEAQTLRAQLGQEETDTLVEDKVDVVKKVFPGAVELQGPKRTQNGIVIENDEKLPFGEPPVADVEDVEEDALFTNNYPAKKGA